MPIQPQARTDTACRNLALRPMHRMVLFVNMCKKVVTAEVLSGLSKLILACLPEHVHVDVALILEPTLVRFDA